MTALQQRQTYLPVPNNSQLYHHLLAKDYEYLVEGGLQSKYPYERVGFDRLLAILNDLELLKLTPPAAVLDIGCNIGLFSLGLASLGYEVVGVDSNIAADTQGFYPEKILGIAQNLKEQLALPTATFVDMDIELFFETNQTQFDICLLLSVVHQWFAGYAGSGLGTKPRARVEEFLQNLTTRINHVIYYEGPEEEIISDMQLSLPAWFLQTSVAQQVTPLSVSVSANGYLRTLYRIEL